MSLRYLPFQGDDTFNRVAANLTVVIAQIVEQQRVITSVSRYFGRLQTGSNIGAQVDILGLIYTHPGLPFSADCLIRISQIWSDFGEMKSPKC